MKKNRILIVDDREQSLYLLRCMLQGHGCEVISATRGAEALSLARQTPPDLIISDILMPGMDGFALCREWRQDTLLKQIPFVFYTATYTDERDRDFGLSLGAERFVLKPQEPDTFMSIIQEVLQRPGGSGTERVRWDEPQRPRGPEEDETASLKQYNEVLVRKLESKMLQLEQANRDLKRDIAAREKIEAELSFRNILLSTQQETSIDGILVVDENGRMISFNNRFIEMWGIPSEVKESRSADFALQSVLHKLEDPSEYLNKVKYLYENRHETGRDEVSLKDGRTFDRYSAPIFGENDRYFGRVWYFRDMTQSKQAKEALNSSMERLHLALEAANSGTWEWDLTTNENVWSEEVWKLYGLEPHSCKPSYDAWLRAIHPDDVKKCEEATKAAVRTGNELRMEWRVRGSGSEPRWVLSRGRPVIGAGGRPVRFLGVVMDVTDLKRAQTTAEEASRAKDDFLAVLSHELRTPLTPVLAAVQLMQRKTEISEETRNHLETIVRNLKLEARLIDDLLDLTRVVRGKLELERKQVNICTVIQRVIETCKSDIDARKIHFNTNIEQAPHPVSGDVGRLQQVFWNLLKNSIKFTRDGGCVGIRCYREDASVIVEVIDSGIGIEPELLPRLFKPFEQGNRGVTRRFGGLGLGLAISKRLVELHGGTISAQSRGKGQGATFRVVLPLSERIAEAERVAGVPQAKVVTSRILLVEDHGDTAVMMKSLLDASGYEVETAGDVEQALSATNSRQFDLLISDLGLPDRSGLDLMKELRSRGNLLKGIALSGFGREEDVSRSKAVGFSEHLTKPVDFDVLENAIERVIRA